MPPAEQHPRLSEKELAYMDRASRTQAPQDILDKLQKDRQKKGDTGPSRSAVYRYSGLALDTSFSVFGGLWFGMFCN